MAVAARDVCAVRARRQAIARGGSGAFHEARPRLYRLQGRQFRARQRVDERYFFVLSGGGAGALPSDLSEYAWRELIDMLGRSTFTSSVRVRLAGSGFDE